MCCNNVVLMLTGLQDCVQRRPAHPRHQPGVLGAGGAGRHLQVVLQDPSDRYRVVSRALNEGSRSFKTPTRTFSGLKAPTSAFTFKTLLRQLRHYAKQVLTPRSLNVKLGP